MDDIYTREEKKVLEIFAFYGLYEPIAKDCIASRNSQELETVIEFIERYGKYINR